ncbi:hypothetical protein, partial [Klebsiella pneumoniae]|uniref:hypothetical protein n=1 Tax=Klebsiella pneumoniae TaxID=573 RepID=UPI00272EE8F6
MAEHIDMSVAHNIRYQHRLRAPQGVSDGKPVKQATNHPKTGRKRAGPVFTQCMSSRAREKPGNSPHSARGGPFSGVLFPRKR